MKLRDKSKVSGFVSEIAEDGFTVVNEKTGSVAKIHYSQVKQVKGSDLSKTTAMVVTIGFIIVMGVLFALVWD